MGEIKRYRQRVVSTVAAIIGGGIAGLVAAMMDPTKYHFPQDLGTGKGWPFFWMGALLTISGMILHSELGQKIMGTLKQSQIQLEETQAELKALKDKAAGQGDKK